MLSSPKSMQTDLYALHTFFGFGSEVKSRLQRCSQHQSKEAPIAAGCSDGDGRSETNSTCIRYYLQHESDRAPTPACAPTDG
jgi:hypothetical protein